jgi:hypothetical protein
MCGIELFVTPTRLVTREMSQPRWGWFNLHPLPRVAPPLRARAGQPWAGGHNPFGIAAQRTTRIGEFVTRARIPWPPLDNLACECVIPVMTTSLSFGFVFAKETLSQSYC